VKGDGESATQFIGIGVPQLLERVLEHPLPADSYAERHGSSNGGLLDLLQLGFEVCPLYVKMQLMSIDKDSQSLVINDLIAT
jgi:hypothetical protein